MARVSVRIDDFEDGALPPVCASSGEAADRLYRVAANYKPSWPVVFILLGPVGWLIMLVAAAGTERRVRGFLPFSDGTQHRGRELRQRAFRTAAVLTAVGAVVVVSLALLHYAMAAFLAAIVSIAVAGFFVSTGRRPAGSVGVKLNRNGRTVELTGVSPAFAQAYQRTEADRLAARQSQPSRSPF